MKLRISLLVAILLIAAALGLSVLAHRSVTPTPPSHPAPAASAPAPNSAPAVASSAPDTAIPGPAAAFVDRFRALDTQSRWSVSDGWSNGDWVENDWRRTQVNLVPDGLSLTMAANPGGAEKPYTSGEISSSQTYRYGYFETRFRMPHGSGLVVGAFTFTREAGPRSWQEIDMEITGRDTTTIELTYHVGGRPTKVVAALGFDAADGFHTYAFDWQPDVINWYIDGRLVLASRGPDVERMTSPQRYIINLWNSEQLNRWVGPIRGEQAPWTLTVACVAHAPAYPGHELCTGNGASTATD